MYAGDVPDHLMLTVFDRIISSCFSPPFTPDILMPVSMTLNQHGTQSRGIPMRYSVIEAIYFKQTKNVNKKAPEATGGYKPQVGLIFGWTSEGVGNWCSESSSFANGHHVRE
jgi:hypothetical protein